jgi:hypothetical protein
MKQTLPTRLGKTTRRRTIHGTPMVYTVVDEDVFVAPSNKNKAFCLHKLRHQDGRESFRIAYYMIAQKPRMKGKWAYGQSAPMMTQEEMSMIFKKARAKGWI